MGKRPYYVVTYERDCEGYYTEVCYIGSNWKAAVDRYRAAYDKIKEMDFTRHGLTDEQIYTEFRNPTEKLFPGQNIRSYINDDNMCWDSVCLLCMKANEFSQQGWEDYYKACFPNSKY